MKSNIFETFIGALVIILALAFLFYGFSIADNSSGNNYKVSAVFNLSLIHI